MSSRKPSGRQHGDAAEPHGRHDATKQHQGITAPGATRPMKGEDDQGGKMTPEMRTQMLQTQHRRTLWVYPAVLLLGVWLMCAPATFGYDSTDMTWSDLASGALLVVLGLLSLHPHRLWAPWAACMVGLWLEFAPLALWAPSAAAYANDTLVGVLVIALTVLVPGMPGMMLFMEHGPEVPPGWSYNPSSWLQRTPIIALGIVGWFVSRYLAAYQLGYLATAWDPIFGQGTMNILDSKVSRAWPISDAGFGAFAYTLEALMGFMGGPARWRTMPWMVTFFGILVIPLGVVSITLVVLQPVAVGSWCTLCLLTALAMLIMIPLTVDEVVAMGQFLARHRHEGEPFWEVFWQGGTEEGGGPDERSPSYIAPLDESAAASMWGMDVPWSLLLCALLGVWLMASPAVFESSSLADGDHLLGALIVTFAVIAMAEVTRALRFVNVLAGLWILAAPWLLGGTGTAAMWSHVVAGALVILLSLPKGSAKESYGSWEKIIF
ncbi:MAG TPA: vitamin K epoxide reductase family protein [Trueperaceae bacterium]